MYKILGLLQVGDKYCVSVEGDSQLLKNGMELIDENGNRYLIETVGMVHYKNIDDYKIKAELILKGNIKDIGKTLDIATNDNVRL